MFPDGLMHTAPLYFPGTFNPLVSAFTVPETLSAEGLLGGGPFFGGFTYPGHFLALVATSVAALMVVVFPLTQVIVPPETNDAVGIGWVVPPVLAVPEHPLMVMVPLTVPVMVVQTTFPWGPLAAHAGPPLTRAAPETVTVRASTAPNIRRLRMLASCFSVVWNPLRGIHTVPPQIRRMA